MKDWKISVENLLHYLPDDIRLKGEQTAESYLYLYTIENALRLFIDTTLQTTMGNEYFAKAGNSDMRKLVAGRKNSESQRKWVAVRGNKEIFYLDFDHLRLLMMNNWEYFQYSFPDKTWISVKMTELGECRNKIAHNTSLTEDEIQLVHLYFNQIIPCLNINNNKTSSTRVWDETAEDSCFIIGAKHPKVYTYQEICKGGRYELSYPANLDVKPLFIQFYYMQVGIWFEALFHNTKTRLDYKFDIGWEHVDKEIRHLKNTLKFQICQYDFDQDGIDEVVIGVQDNTSGNNGVQVNIFKYFPPVFMEHAGRPENWKLVGNLSGSLILGQPQAFITGQSIKIPRYLRGFYYELTWVKNGFLATGYH